MRTGRLLLITMKRYLKKPGFLILLFLMLILSFLLQNNTAKENSSIEVAFYCDNSREGQILISRLEEYDGLFHFALLGNEDEVYTMVGRGDYECGYLIPDDLIEELLSGNREELITVVTSPSTTMATVINETLYSLLFDEIAKEALLSYLSGSSAIADYYGEAFSDEDVYSLYELYRNNGSTFHFDYEGAPDDFSLSSSAVLLSPTRGLIAVFILLGGFSGVLSLYKEAKNPLFMRRNVRLISILTPMVLLGITGLASLFILQITDNPLMEIVSMLGYLLLCLGFLYLLHKFIKNQILFATLIPIYLLGCLIFTPVFFDAAIFLPALKPVSYLFIPYYYLALF